jgi:hypothetical protein
MLKKTAALFTITLLMLVAIPCFASANGPPPDTSITIMVVNPPAEAAYIDILVDKSLKEINAASPNPDVFAAYPIIVNSELVSCDSDGYVSYSLFYEHDAYSNAQFLNLEFHQRSGNKFSGAFDFDINSIKIVLLDGSGKILQISDTVVLAQPDDHIHTPTSIVSYDYNSNIAKVKFLVDTSSITFVVMMFMAVFRMLFSTGVEIIIAVPFKIKRIKVLVIVNIITQTIISLGIPIVTMLMSYTVSVVIFEILIYILEFFAYLNFLREPKWKKVLLYTVTANTASLLLGLLLNSMGFFWA